MSVVENNNWNPETQKPFKVDPRLKVLISRKAFIVDNRINVLLDFDLAIRVGETLLKAGVADNQMVALGHQLVNLGADPE